MNSGRYTDLRFREGAFEARCRLCDEWWPLTVDDAGKPEYWLPRHGLVRCRACHLAIARNRKAAADPVVEAKREAARLRYRANRATHLAASAAWRERNPERVRAYRREYYLRHRDEAIAAAKAYYREFRPVVLAKKRAVRRGEAAA